MLVAAGEDATEKEVIQSGQLPVKRSETAVLSKGRNIG